MRNNRSQAVYDHSAHARFHTVEGAREALRTLFPCGFPATVLDLGCGTGTWLSACAERGAVEIVGVELVDIAESELLVPIQYIRVADLCRPFALNRRFDLVLCLETVEHLDPDCAETIVDTITRHGDCVLFSAAAPGQPGENHINCQWPTYWQSLFNSRGFVCDDSARWIIWDNEVIEPWYRQNMMMVSRNAERAGQEPRVKGVIHPQMATMNAWQYLDANTKVIEDGALPWSWYPIALVKALAAKISRRIRRR